MSNSSDTESGKDVLSRVINIFTEGGEPTDHDLKILKGMYIDVDLMREYLHHVNKATKEEIEDV